LDINAFVRQSLEIVERKINQVTRTMTKNKHLKMKRSMSSCKPAIINFVMHKQGNQDERTKQALSVSKFW
jgi:signal transduction histidine kinase